MSFILKCSNCGNKSKVKNNWGLEVNGFMMFTRGEKIVIICKECDNNINAL